MNPKNANPLSKLTDRGMTGSRTVPPHALLESTDHYSVVLNLLGIEMKNIALRLDEKKRELTVLAKKESPLFRSGYYWMFQLPVHTSLSEIRTIYRNGALEIRMPKTAEAA